MPRQSTLACCRRVLLLWQLGGRDQLSDYRRRPATGASRGILYPARATRNWVMVQESEEVAALAEQRNLGDVAPAFSHGPIAPRDSPLARKPDGLRPPPPLSWSTAAADRRHLLGSPADRQWRLAFPSPTRCSSAALQLMWHLRSVRRADPGAEPSSTAQTLFPLLARAASSCWRARS